MMRVYRNGLAKEDKKMGTILLTLQKEQQPNNSPSQEITEVHLFSPHPPSTSFLCFL